MVLGPLLLVLMNCDEISQMICIQMPRVNGTVMEVKKGDREKNEGREGGREACGWRRDLIAEVVVRHPASTGRRSALLAVRVHLIHNLHIPDY